jgi:hypothetical protein
MADERTSRAAEAIPHRLPHQRRPSVMVSAASQMPSCVSKELLIVVTAALASFRRSLGSEGERRSADKPQFALEIESE